MALGAAVTPGFLFGYTTILFLANLGIGALVAFLWRAEGLRNRNAIAANQAGVGAVAGMIKGNVQVEELAAKMLADLDQVDADLAINRVLARGKNHGTMLYFSGSPEDPDGIVYGRRTGAAGDERRIGYDPDAPASARPSTLLRSIGGEACWDLYRPHYVAALGGVDGWRADCFGEDRALFLVQVIHDDHTGGGVVFGLNISGILERAGVAADTVKALEQSHRWFAEGSELS